VIAVRQPSQVRIERLEKRFGTFVALEGIDLAIRAGRITAIVGPNAAGKSTLIKAIVGLVRPGGGTILIDDQPVNGDETYRRRIGYMPQAAQFPSELTGREVLGLLLDLRGRPEGVDQELIELFALERSLDRPIRTLSGGTKQKLNAVVAFLFRPSLVILDEPTAGLDPVASAVLKDKVLAAPACGTTVILTSHILSEIDELAQDIVFLVEGKIEFQGTVESLKARAGEVRLDRAIAALLRARS
jgi:Cu-processing system ATP-binding protein